MNEMYNNILTEMNLAEKVKKSARSKNLKDAVSTAGNIAAVILGVAVVCLVIAGVVVGFAYPTVWSIFLLAFCFFVIVTAFSMAFDDFTLEDEVKRNVINGLVVFALFFINAGLILALNPIIGFSFGTADFNFWETSVYEVATTDLFIAKFIANMSICLAYLIGNPVFHIFDWLDCNKYAATKEVLIEDVLKSTGNEDKKLLVLRQHPEWIEYVKEPTPEMITYTEACLSAKSLDSSKAMELCKLYKYAEYCLKHPGTTMEEFDQVFVEYSCS